MMLFRQIFMQIWNQRRQNVWLWVELTVVSVLLWYAVDLIFNYAYAAFHPKGYDTGCVFDLTVGTKPLSLLDAEDNHRAGEDFTYLYNQIKEYPGVEAVCAYYGSVPYSDNSMYEGYSPHTDSTRTVQCYIRYVSDTYFDVFRLNPVAGKLDRAHWSKHEVPMPVLMSAELADSLFGTSGADALGRTCFNPYFMRSKQPVTNYRVMAVLPSHKLDDYQRYVPFIYLPLQQERPVFWQNIGIRVRPDAAVGFAERFRADMQQPFDRGIFYLNQICSYQSMKEAFDIEQGTVNYLNTAYAVSAFFLFTVFLGLLGIFVYRTYKRRGEIALRMAVGSSRRDIFLYYIGEGLVLLLLATGPALVLAGNIQLADLTVHTLVDVSLVRFFFTFAVSIVMLAVVITLGIWIPARKAMKVQPAEALHEE